MPDIQFDTTPGDVPVYGWNKEAMTFDGNSKWVKAAREGGNVVGTIVPCTNNLGLIITEAFICLPKTLKDSKIVISLSSHNAWVSFIAFIDFPLKPCSFFNELSESKIAPVNIGHHSMAKAIMDAAGNSDKDALLVHRIFLS
jgi:hypothetical protein